jgi:site-specific DNA-methyltransferase (adenine-specific)
VPSRPFFETGSLAIFHDDVRSTRALQPGTVDLIVTSPPYNVDIAYGKHNDGLSYASYREFSRQWLERCFEWLRDDGRLCLNIPLDKNKDGQQSVGADLTGIAKAAGFQYHSTIIWNEGNISRRTAWGSWMSASAPYVIAPVELIVVLYRAHWKRASSGQSTITRQEFMDWTNGLWTFNGESRKRAGHPAPFPLELPRRCIKLFSYLGDTVLDPFMGSGTTLVAAAETGRLGIGIELEQKYCVVARTRLKSALAHLAPMPHDEEPCQSESSSPAARSTSTTTRSTAPSRSRTRTSRKS